MSKITDEKLSGVSFHNNLVDRHHIYTSWSTSSTNVSSSCLGGKPRYRICLKTSDLSSLLSIRLAQQTKTRGLCGITRSIRACQLPTCALTSMVKLLWPRRPRWCEWFVGTTPPSGCFLCVPFLSRGQEFSATSRIYPFCLGGQS